MGDCQKNLRLSQRPVFQVISLVDSCLSSMHKFGTKAGIIFKQDIPIRENTKVPRPLQNCLAFDPDSSILPLPNLPSLSEGLVSLTDEDAIMLKQNEENYVSAIEEYRSSVVSLFNSFFGCVSQKMNDVDAYLAFYCDLYGHVDA